MVDLDDKGIIIEGQEQEKKQVEEVEEAEEEDDVDVPDEYVGRVPVPAVAVVKKVLVPWACRYCGADDPSSVVKCVESNSWFCNGGNNASHIIQHLVKSKHKEVSLHPDSPLGDTVIECYNCANRNIFLMGFIPAKGEAVVVLLCRNCLGMKNLKDLGWKLDSWSPLIQDRSLVNWLVKPSNQTRNIPTSQINKLEDLWKTKPDATIDDLDKPGVEGDELHPVQLRYTDAFEYQRVFKALVDVETAYDRETKEHLREDNVSVSWMKSEVSGRVTAELAFSLSTSETLRLNIGDELKLTFSRANVVVVNGNNNMNMNTSSSTNASNISAVTNTSTLLSTSGGNTTTAIPSNNNTNNNNNNNNNQRSSGKGIIIPIRPESDWEGKGTVLKIDDDGRTVIEMLSSTGIPFSVSEGYTVSYVWRPVTFDRMQAAMKTFANDDSSLSGYLYHKLLGHDVEEQLLRVDSLPKKLNAPGLPELNSSQADAIRQVLTKPLALIQGPPGTGKTVTSASLIYHLSKLNPNDQILVCAPSNVAVDQLTEKIDATGLRVVRVSAISREHIETNVEHLALHNIILNLESKESSEVASLIEKQESGGHLTKQESKRLERLRKKLEKEVMEAADVICVTCSGAADRRLGVKRRFRHVLLDEATQATEPESLIPIVMGCKQFILVGDHCQLGPVVMCKKAASAGLNTSLFERLVALGHRPVRLAIQYRMHPCLSEFPSNTFYEGSLQNGVSAEERSKPNLDFPWPNKDKPLIFYACMGPEEIAGTGTSYLNRTEAINCEKVVTALLKAGVSPNQIGVITPYDGQRIFITQTLQRGPLQPKLYKDIEVQSVDAFQGREKDYIILSCVRSNERQGIGFLTDPRRLNVALTRARLGCIILGNPRVLAKRPLWNALLVHVREQGLLVEGSLGNLQISLMRFPTTKKYYSDRRQRAFQEHNNAVFSGDLSNPYGTQKSKPSVVEASDDVPDSRYDPRYDEAVKAASTSTTNIASTATGPHTWGFGLGEWTF